MTSPRIINANHKNDLRLLLFIAALVALSGLLTLGSLLFSLLGFHHIHVDRDDVFVTLLAGFSLIYLADLLNRGKRNAWLVSIPLYTILVVRNVHHYIIDFPNSLHDHSLAIFNILIPGLTLILLIVGRSLFTVRSEMRSFTTALTRSLIILLVAFVYGVVGFSLMDDHDFHQEIPPITAAHYTIDQFNLTTNHQVIAYSKRAAIFVDSLAVVSVAALFYAALAFFSPIRFRLSHHQQDYADMTAILRRYATTSEDFFKLWPADKAYFFSRDRCNALAYKASRGTALVVGDPVGPRNQLGSLMQEFMAFCRLNDWHPALIHAEGINLDIYHQLGFEAQKIGEEAIIEIDNFVKDVGTSKDFRHIRNKFNKLGYRVELLKPPHSQSVMERLKDISDDWLKAPGRAERGFMMGYFSSTYIQKCDVITACDGRGVIKAFINQVPSPLAKEANYDFLRQAHASPGNISDYLLLGFIDILQAQGIARLNLGLAPLSGLEDSQNSASGLLNGFLNFTSNSGGRFYSFKGLKRFKAKYQPSWEDRYIVYTGGLRGFSKTINGLMSAMSVRNKSR